MQTVELKPWRNGLLNEMLLGVPAEDAWEEVWARVEARLEEAKISSSLTGAQLTIELGLRSVSYDELVWLVDRLKTHYGLLTVAVVSTDYVTRDAARRLTLNTYQMLPGGSKDSAETISRSNALYLPQTIRSGQRIVTDGHLIIGGDVNAGAEVIAAGDIVVTGTLRGLAHAGSGGDESARIIAGSMRPHQLRIAGEIARSPEDSPAAANTARHPEMARIENGAIQVFSI